MPVSFDLFCGTTFFLLGAVVGSFLNVVIIRVPLGESLVHPPSRCPHCGHPVRFYDNIPILSYFLLRGTCRDCGTPISFRYPLIEAITAGLSVGLYFKFGLTPALGVFFLFCAAMNAVFWIDLDHMIIPDVISLNGLPVGLVASTVGFIPEMTWSTTIAGTVLGAAILYIPAVIYERVRGVEGLGRGDIKLLATIGAFTGPVGVIFVLFFASVTGCLAAVIGMAFKGVQSSAPIPFGPFLTVSAVIFIFSGPAVVDMFVGLSHWFWQALNVVGFAFGPGLWT
jgi:leader peptidase (prepilin peptidase) / N-methyltransferase